MIKSMTGFGSSEVTSDERKITIEIKTVNHRYCDINIKLPRQLTFLEAKIKAIIKTYVERGKVDVFISYDEYTSNKLSVKFNEDIAEKYMNVFEHMGNRFNINNDIRVSSLARFPEVITLEEETNKDELWPLIEKAITKATQELVEARSLEGKNLYEDLLSKLDIINTCVSFIEDRSPQIVEEYNNNLKARTLELLGETQLDESVLATTVATFADKVCVDEELVRLNSHTLNMRQTLESEDGIGRKLDFIAQEMNREANTIVSKVNDLEVTNVAIDLKTEIEKIREQVQNIE